MMISRSLYVILLCAILLNLVDANFRLKTTLSIRAGSTSFQPSSDTSNQTDNEDDVGGNDEEEDVSPTQEKPRKRSVMDYESISLALRLTCELNRKLFLATDSSSGNDETSIFYTEPSKRKELKTFIRDIFQKFKCENDPYVAAITLIYLDRACSVETDRTSPNGDQFLPCPFLNTSNVHRLFLTANILALRTYRNELPHSLQYHDDITRYYAMALHTDKDSDDFIQQISEFELGNMLEWMVQSLGSEGLTIHVSEVNSFIEKWLNLFEWESTEQE